MHPLNPYATRKPDFVALAAKHPSFAPYVKTVDSKGGAPATAPTHAHIDFQDAGALRALTACLLKEDWGCDVELRADRLCPTLANRLDYLYHILDLEPYLPKRSSSVGPSGDDADASCLRVLDIGTGHIAIYPLLLRKLRPEAQIVGTELDEVSFHHAVQTRQRNDIPSTSISLLRPTPNQQILFPIFGELKEATTNSSSPNQKWDIVICNPPFFGSEAEMKEGIAAKAGSAPAAPTAAVNELVTRGGEVAFVGQMIEESVQLGEACAWYTSLIGKYASLAPLVEQLRAAKVDTYFIIILRQSRTTRWILGWSHTAIRLPDSLLRPSDFMSGTSFARLLPPLNSFSHTPSPSQTPAELRDKVIDILASIQLHDQPKADKQEGECTSDGPVDIAPISNTWSRAARRQAARQASATDGSRTMLDPATSAPLFRAHFTFTTPIPAPQQPKASSEPLLTRSATSENEPATDAEPVESAVAIEETDRTDKGADAAVEATTASRAGEVKLVWTEGRDRAAVEALWKFVLSKAGLVRGR